MKQIGFSRVTLWETLFQIFGGRENFKWLQGEYDEEQVIYRHFTGSEILCPTLEMYRNGDTSRNGKLDLARIAEREAAAEKAKADSAQISGSVHGRPSQPSTSNENAADLLPNDTPLVPVKPEDKPSGTLNLDILCNFF